MVIDRSIVKRFSFLFPICIAAALSSCVEITQYVGMEQGKLLVDSRIIIQKALSAMAESMGGGAEALTFSDANVADLRSSFPAEMLQSVERIDTELETGLSLRLRYASGEVPDLGGSSIPVFFPYRKGPSLIVDIANPDSSGSAESNQMAAAIISGFKYRLLIDRSVLPNPSSAVIVSDEGSVPATLISYPGVAVVEISMGFIFAARSPLKLVIE